MGRTFATDTAHPCLLWFLADGEFVLSGTGWKMAKGEMGDGHCVFGEVVLSVSGHGETGSKRDECVEWRNSLSEV